MLSWVSVAGKTVPIIQAVENLVHFRESMLDELGEIKRRLNRIEMQM